MQGKRTTPAARKAKARKVADESAQFDKLLEEGEKRLSRLQAARKALESNTERLLEKQRERGERMKKQWKDVGGKALPLPEEPPRAEGLWCIVASSTNCIRLSGAMNTIGSCFSVWS